MKAIDLFILVEVEGWAGGRHGSFFLVLLMAVTEDLTATCSSAILFSA